MQPLMHLTDWVALETGWSSRGSNSREFCGVSLSWNVACLVIVHSRVMTKTGTVTQPRTEEQVKSHNDNCPEQQENKHIYTRALNIKITENRLDNRDLYKTDTVNPITNRPKATEEQRTDTKRGLAWTIRTNTVTDLSWITAEQIMNIGRWTEIKQNKSDWPIADTKRSQRDWKQKQTQDSRQRDLTQEHRPAESRQQHTFK